MGSQAVAVESSEIPVELRVLLDCGRQALTTSGSTATAISETGVGERIDWQRVRDLARRHRLEPLLFRALTKWPPSERPTELYETLDERLTRLRMHNLSVIAELVELINRFEAADVPVLAYKGPVVASRVYGDAALRAYEDLDLVVPASNRERAFRVLRDRGYEQRKVNGPVFETVFKRPDEHPTIDLHTRVVPEFFPFELPFEDLYSRRTTVEVGGDSVPTFAVDDAFLVHAIHGSKHHWFRLEWVLGTAALAQQLPRPLGTITRAERLGCERMALLALELARRLFDATFPAGVERRLDSESASMAVVRTAADDVVSWLVDDEWTGRNVKRTHIADFRLRSRLVSGPVSKVRFWSRALTNPRAEDYEWIDLPDLLTPLYRVLRPVRLLYEYRGSIVEKYRESTG